MPVSHLPFGSPNGDKDDYTDYFRHFSLDSQAAIHRRYQGVLEPPFQISPRVPQHPDPYAQRQAAFPLPAHLSPYTQLAYYEVLPSAGHSGCQSLPARPPSDQATSMNSSPHNPYGPRPPCSQPNISQRNKVQTQGTSGTIWGNPPMSPVGPSMQFDFTGAMSGVGCGRHAHHGFSVDELGNITPAAYYRTSAAWNGPSTSDYAYHAPCQAQPALNANSDWPRRTSPLFSQQPFNHRGSWDPPLPPQQRPANRTSWSGPSRSVNFPGDDRQRKPYHPPPAAKRSDWAMWVGNVPPNASHEELWKYFNSTIPTTGDGNGEPWRGPSSIFLISRSSCAFVNFSSQPDLDRAVAFFNGKSLRPWDPRCFPIVCRVRRKDDDLRAGVGAQRGTKMHREWVMQQGPQAAQAQPGLPGLPAPPAPLGPVQTPSTTFSSLPPSPPILELPPDGDGRRRKSIVDGQSLDTKHRSTNNSYASTNSSFLALHFPKRIFILKSITTAELEDSVKTGVWRTQKHNEPILDQAFRTSSEVFLIFGANRSGQFFGYAKMIEPIRKQRARSFSQSSKMTLGPGSGSGSGSSHHISKYCSQPQHKRIRKERARAGSDPAPSRILHFPTRSRRAISLPGDIMPGEEMQANAHCQRHTDLSPLRLVPKRDRARIRASTLDAKVVPNLYFSRGPISITSGGERETEKRQLLGGFKRILDQEEDAVLPKPTFVVGEEMPRRPDEEVVVRPGGWSQPFKVQWIRIGSLPFSRIRHVRNPWNADRAVKVSRDGTEVEPSVGALLMAEWDRM